jgi:translation initiation factor IF-2
VIGNKFPSFYQGLPHLPSARTYLVRPLQHLTLNPLPASRARVASARRPHPVSAPARRPLPSPGPRYSPASPGLAAAPGPIAPRRVPASPGLRPAGAHGREAASVPFPLSAPAGRAAAAGLPTWLTSQAELGGVGKVSGGRSLLRLHGPNPSAEAAAAAPAQAPEPPPRRTFPAPGSRRFPARHAQRARPRREGEGARARGGERRGGSAPPASARPGRGFRRAWEARGREARGREAGPVP